MRTLRAGFVIALVAIGVAVGYLSGQGSVSAASDGLTAQDYADIQQLYWRYNHAMDFRDPQLLASAFSDDAVFSTGLRPDAVGRQDILAFISNEKGTDSGIRHWNNSWHVTPTSEGAEGRVYWMVLDVGAGGSVGNLPGASWTHRSTGVYDDVYVKTAEGWRIKSRTLNFDEAD